MSKEPSELDIDAEDAVPREVGAESSVGVRERIGIHKALAVLERISSDHTVSLQRGADRFAGLAADIADLRKSQGAQVVAARQEWEAKLDKQTAELKTDLVTQTGELKKELEKLQPKRLGWLTVAGLVVAIIAGPVVALIVAAFNAGAYPTRVEIDEWRKSTAAEIQHQRESLIRIETKLGIPGPVGP